MYRLRIYTFRLGTRLAPSVAQPDRKTPDTIPNPPLIRTVYITPDIMVYTYNTTVTKKKKKR